jgi:hypothetical protein
VTRSSDTLEQTLLAETDGTRTWTVWAATREELLERVTLIFAEHVHDDDEIHIAYNAMQTGWQDHPPAKANDASFTQLFFEYSALIVVRHRRRQLDRELVDALQALVDRLSGP